MPAYWCLSPKSLPLYSRYPLCRQCEIPRLKSTESCGYLGLISLTCSRSSRRRRPTPPTRRRGRRVVLCRRQAVGRGHRNLVRRVHYGVDPLSVHDIAGGADEQREDRQGLGRLSVVAYVRRGVVIVADLSLRSRFVRPKLRLCSSLSLPVLSSC